MLNWTTTALTAYSKSSHDLPKIPPSRGRNDLSTIINSCESARTHTQPRLLLSSLRDQRRDGLFNWTTGAVEQTVLGRYMAATGTDEDAALGDLLADLRHMVDRDNYDYELADARAESHYVDEIAQQAVGSRSARLQEIGDDIRR